MAINRQRMASAKISITQLLIIFLATAVAIAYYSAEEDSRKKRESYVPKVEPAPSESPEQKREREERHAAADKIVETLQESRILGDIRVANRVGRVVAEVNFMMASFKDKELAASVAYDWCHSHDPKCKILVLHDWQTNKEIGRYNPASGGLVID